MTTDASAHPAEQLSALVDGHLDADAGAAVVQRLQTDAALCAQWHSFQVIGDVLRNPALAPRPRELDFLDRLRPALAAEATALRQPEEGAQTVVVAPVAAPASNQEPFRWRLVAGVAVATLALGVFIGNYHAGQGAAGTLASATTPPDRLAAQGTAQETPAVMIRDPELDALLAAHQQMAGSTALQKPSGFLRNATFERPR